MRGRIHLEMLGHIYQNMRGRIHLEMRGLICQNMRGRIFLEMRGRMCLEIRGRMCLEMRGRISPYCEVASPCEVAMIFNLKTQNPFYTILSNSHLLNGFNSIPFSL